MLASGSHGWIIDTCATNHKISDLGLLNHESVKKIIIPRKIQLTNGDVSLITHTCTSKISNKNIISNVFYVP